MLGAGEFSPGAFAVPNFAGNDAVFVEAPFQGHGGRGFGGTPTFNPGAFQPTGTPTGTPTRTPDITTGGGGAGSSGGRGGGGLNVSTSGGGGGGGGAGSGVVTNVTISQGQDADQSVGGSPLVLGLVFAVALVAVALIVKR